jgi:tetratricopeptide (TPR) repeat protein
MGEVFYLNSRTGIGDGADVNLGTLRHLTGMSPGEFAAAIADEAGEPLPASVYMAYEDGEPAPTVILSAASRVATRARPAGISPATASSREARSSLSTTTQILPGPHAGPGNDADEVASAAREAEADHSLLLAEPGPQSIDCLWHAALEVARAANRSAAQTFAAAHRLRRHALELASETRRPGALSDLYLITGQATALMASTAFDLNRWDESAALARSATSYAALVGNSSLHAWTLGLAALLANWRIEPDTALDHFRHGIKVAPPGAPRVRLRYIAARSYALLGDASSLGRVVDQARRDQDDAARHRDPISDEIAGEFAFSPARAEACAASAWLDLGRGREAKVSAQRALDDLATLPVGRQPLSQVTGARIDLATACLLERERDQAEEALSRIIAAAPSRLRNVSLAGRLARTRKALAAPHWSGDPVAQHLSDAIGEWLTGRQ